jgi:predicted small metal-binding protein
MDAGRPRKDPDAMKQFSCGDVVPGCDAHFTGSNEDDILAQVAAHARSVHHLDVVPQSLVDAVLRHISVAA